MEQKLVLLNQEQLNQITPSKLVAAASLLTAKDMTDVRTNNLMFVAFQVQEERFLVRLENMIPKDATPYRVNGVIQGFPALVGGI